MDLAWDDDSAIWAGGGNGTLLVSRDGGDSWENDPGGDRQPAFHPHGVRRGAAFVLGERETCCAGWATLPAARRSAPAHLSHLKIIVLIRPTPWPPAQQENIRSSKSSRASVTG